MSEPSKPDIAAIFKRLRGVPTNKVRVPPGLLSVDEEVEPRRLTRRTLTNAEANVN